LGCAIGSNRAVFETSEKPGSFDDKFDTRATATSRTVAGPIEALSQRASLLKNKKTLIYILGSCTPSGIA
jgi:hypothetical protein